MRPLYFLLKILIFYGINLFFKKKKTINAPKTFNAQTIFVVNHASAFLDPWVIAELQRPILFFLARGDIFKKWLHPITWAAHMIPIFRTKENGADSAEKNEVIFQEVYSLLKRKKSIMIFGEGYTDDIFIRSLKPIKKGPARMGFGAMESSNWEQDIKIQSIGINYADPNEFRSDVLVANAVPIHLKDFKEEYKENPSKAILSITKKITEDLQNQLTYLEDKKLTDLHNHIQSITKKGIAHLQSDRSIDLEKRWKYSQNLAKAINKDYTTDNKKWQTLKDNLNLYFTDLKKNKIKDQWVLDYSSGKKPLIFGRLLLLVLSLPLFLAGAFHHLIPYLVSKRFIERTFKRRVFWSGIKLILGYFILAIFNIALCFTINGYFNIMHYGFVWLYIILVVPFLGLFAYWYADFLKDTINRSKLNSTDYKIWQERRNECTNLIEEIIHIK